MSLIDLNDDALHRYVVWHYHFVEERHERKLEAICAYSTRREAEKYFRKKSAELLQLQSEGQADSKEYFSCGYRRPGYKEGVTSTRLEIRKMRSGWIAQGLTKRQTSGKPDFQSPK